MSAIRAGCRVGHNDISEILQCLDIFVLPSLAEGISNTLLEAMACASHVMATDVGGNPEILLNGKTGCFVSRGYRESIASVLEVYVRDDKLGAAHGWQADFASSGNSA